MIPPRKRWLLAVLFAVSVARSEAPVQAAAELRLGKDFLDGVVEKLPPATFDKADKYRGSVHSYRLVAIAPQARQFLIVCQIEGEFHPPVTGPISERVVRSPQTPEGWRKFHFDVKARVNIEPGMQGAPRFRIAIDEVKKRELEGFSGLLATLLGQYFNELVTQIASGRAVRLNKRLNDEVMKRVGLFKDYGVLQAIDYAPSEVVLHFDSTRFRSEGIAGYVFEAERPGTVPLYRWLHPRDGSHYYTIQPNAPDRPNSVADGIACHVFGNQAPEAVPFFRWTNGRDYLYTTVENGENAGRVGHRFQGIVGYVYRDPRPGTVPLYRFYDPVRHQHFYTRHPNAEFAK